MIEEGKQVLKAFCKASDYEYNEELVDRILATEQKYQSQMNISSKNIFRFPILRSVLLKLAAAYFTVSMLYYGILLGTLPGGVLETNLILGFVGICSGPCMCLLIKSRFGNRRTLMAALYAISGVAVILMAFTSQYKDSSVALVFATISYGVVCGVYRIWCEEFIFLLRSELASIHI